MTALAELLAIRGHNVTVLFTPGPHVQSAQSAQGVEEGLPFEHWVRHYARKNIRLVVRPGVAPRTRLRANRRTKLFLRGFRKNSLCWGDQFAFCTRRCC